jgi:hypothetical protein
MQLKNKLKKFLVTKHVIKHFVYECHVQKMIRYGDGMSGTGFLLHFLSKFPQYQLRWWSYVTFFAIARKLFVYTFFPTW